MAADREPPRVVLRDPDEDLVALLRDAQFAVLKYPAATQAAFRALIAEGRRFAETPPGRRWKERLADSEVVRRGRVLLENSAFGMLEERGDTVLPSSLLDALVGVLMSPDWLARLEQLARPLFGNDDDARSRR